MKYLLSASTPFCSSLWSLPDKKLLINTINAHSYNMAQKDREFALDSELRCSASRRDQHCLCPPVPEGIALRKIAGADLFDYEMKRLNEKKGTVSSWVVTS